MGTKCTSESYERRPPIVTSPVVSSLRSETLASDDCSGAGSGDVAAAATAARTSHHPLPAFMTEWFRALPPPTSALPAVPENEIVSDGEREFEDWLATEPEDADADAARWDAPRYVRAVALDTPTETETPAQRRRRKKTGGARCA